MATHRLFVPGFRFTSLNAMMGQHWAKVAKMKKADRQWVGTYAMLRDIPKALGKRRVSLEVVITGRQQETDPDSLWKSALDSLVHTRLLVDDSPRYCELGTVTYRRNGELGTTIVLADCVVDS